MYNRATNRNHSNVELGKYDKTINTVENSEDISSNTQINVAKNSFHFYNKFQDIIITIDQSFYFQIYLLRISSA
jgi:hypothetical protein